MSVAVGSVLNLVQRQLDVPETQKFIGEQFFADETESVLAMAVDRRPGREDTFPPPSARLMCAMIWAN